MSKWPPWLPQWIIWFGAWIVTFPIIWFVFSKFQKHRPVLKRPAFWIVWLFGTLVLLVLAVYATVSYLTYVPSREFNRESWISRPEKRIELIDDLVDSHRLDTLSREGVVTLLGEPEQDNYYFQSSGRDMIYYLGPERSLFGVDSEWLLIWLRNGKVDHYELARD